MAADIALSPRPLQKMFMAVPPSYDRLNRLLTLRLDEHWRKKAARCLWKHVQQNQREAGAAVLSEGELPRLLDLCTGTADLAIRLRAISAQQAQVHALDFSAPMLKVAAEKARKRKFDDILFRQGDAADMPYDSSYFDAVGIAFAFRNLSFKNPDTSLFLSEIVRVLKKDGIFVAVETSQPENPWLRRAYHAYMQVVTKTIGGLLSGHKGAYQYLAHSAIHYHKADEIKELLCKAGFSKVSYFPLLGGVAAIWCGYLTDSVYAARITKDACS